MRFNVRVHYSMAEILELWWKKKATRIFISAGCTLQVLDVWIFCVQSKIKLRFVVLVEETKVYIVSYRLFYFQLKSGQIRLDSCYVSLKLRPITTVDSRISKYFLSTSVSSSPENLFDLQTRAHSGQYRL